MGDEVEFKAYEPGQAELFPGHLSEALDPSDPVFFLDDVVDGLDLKRLERRYAKRGEHAYPPRMLLKVWLFAAIEGVYSGREIARRLRWDLRFRYLAGGLYPDFRTINRFRVAHRRDFAEVLRQTVRVAQASGLAKLGRLAIDGSKLRANTSRHKAMSHERMQRAEQQLEDEIAQILAQMDELNESEDDQHGDDDGGGGLPQELRTREQRVAKLRAVREQLETERGKELRATSQKSFADPDANMMMTGEGALQYCYNAQLATSEDGIIVAADVTTTVRDIHALVPMVEATEHNTGETADTVLADNGYLSEDNLEQLHRRQQRCLIATGREGKKARRWPRGPQTRRLHWIMRLPWARRLYAHRKTQGERPFAEIKQTMGFRGFQLRGTDNIRGEWTLVSAAANILTLSRAAAVA